MEIENTSITSIKFYWWISDNIDKTNADGSQWVLNGSNNDSFKLLHNDVWLITTNNEIVIPKGLIGKYIWATIEATVDGYDKVVYSDTAIQQIASTQFIAGDIKPITVRFADNMTNILSTEVGLTNLSPNDIINAEIDLSKWNLNINPEPVADKDSFDEITNNLGINDVSYKWYIVDENDNEIEINNNLSTYTITSDEIGKRIKISYLVNLIDNTNYIWADAYAYEGNKGIISIMSGVITANTLYINNLSMTGSPVYGQIISVSFNISNTQE